MVGQHEVLRVGRGVPLPLGAHESRDGVNIAIFSRHSTAMRLLLYRRAEDAHPAQVIVLDPLHHRSGDIWHVHLAGPIRDMCYGLEADGPFAPEAGHRFRSDRLLLDPYATALAGTALWDFAALAPGGDPAAAPGAGIAKALIIGQDFDWGEDRPPRHPWSDTVIYETHVRGLTIHPSSAVSHPGQYLGVIEKIPHFRRLGVTALELMPVQEFNENEVNWRNPLTGARLRNYWGYSPVAFFAPKESYGTGNAPGAQLIAFKTMVRALHAAGIEVILDVCFNHTAEGDETGPVFGFRGLDNAIYYMLSGDKRHYANFSGCGNTVNCHHPVVRSLIIDCLRHWVVHFHIDGFRFDLASILGRDSRGHLLADPPLLEQIAEDPILRDVKLIAEAWDAGGAYQVGSFPGQRWAEWNAHFRDDVRRFWRGDPGMTGAFATRLCGSADLYGDGDENESPVNSINYVTCHDGFTLNDLVSYGRKHNEANGEDNRDGQSEHYSENNGVEGPSAEARIEAMRARQSRNLLASLLLARGVPMLLGGDEFRRSQDGNNNAWCQDNETSWYDWRLLARHADLVRFVERLTALRRAHPVLRAERFYTGDEIAWFGPEGEPPDWQGADNRLGCLIQEPPQGALCLLFNATLRPCRFLLPPAPGGRWQVALDSAKPAPADIAEAGAEPILLASALDLEGRTTMVLLSRQAV